MMSFTNVLLQTNNNEVTVVYIKTTEHICKIKLQKNMLL